MTSKGRPIVLIRHVQSNKKSKLRGSESIKLARQRLLEDNGNRRFLIEKRLEAVAFVLENSLLEGLEVGSGPGATRLLFPSANLLSTDIQKYDWIQVADVDACALPFVDESFDYLYVPNVLHHINNPWQFFSEASRVLRPGGQLFVQDVNTSLAMRWLLKITNHESYDTTVDAMDPRYRIQRGDDKSPWATNCDISRQFFSRPYEFHQSFPALRIVRDEFHECLTFLNSGGMIVDTPKVPLPQSLLRRVWALDEWLCRLAPSLFSLQRFTVLAKIHESEGSTTSHEPETGIDR